MPTNDKLMNEKGALKASPATILFYNVISKAAVIFAVAAIVPPDRSIPLIIILIVSAVVLRVSAYISHQNRSGIINDTVEGHGDVEEQHSFGTSSIELYSILQKLMTPSSFPMIRIFYASSFTLILTLMIRLFSVDNFGGRPSLLDYGTKVSKNNETSDTNIAFEEFNFGTVGHLVQGLVAAFLSYPAITGLLSKLPAKIKGGDEPLFLGKSSVFVLCFLQLLQASMTIYPFYSMIKRLRYSPSTFAQSSHCNNATEWSLGCVLGVSFGCLASSLIQQKLKVMAESQEGREKIIRSLDVSEEEAHDDYNLEGPNEYAFGKASEYKGIATYPFLLKMVEIVSTLVLGLFSVTSLMTGVYFGLSWNYEEKNQVNEAMVAVFACTWLGSGLMFFFLSRGN